MEIAEILVQILESIELIETNILTNEGIITAQLTDLIKVNRAIKNQLVVLNQNMVAAGPPVSAAINFGSPTDK